MNPEKKPLPSLAEIEREVVAEAREWGRQRLQERLQQLADQQSEIFPPQAAKAPQARSAKRTGKNRAGR